ncbi:MAG: alpha/beta hydrolase [Silicimonas sp.]|jgi:pimeloyl-ACP methyl ester carboxylesterase|nr:alpha/beta hydrolase [Silicimonas sp.]
MTDQKDLTETRRLAYDQTAGRGPGIVFLGGFNSTKDGTKARHLEAWAKAQGRAFLRFDYSGHGSSMGDMRDGSISAWFEDATAIVEGLTKGRQVLVGSSMGGWIACLLARAVPKRVAGLVLIAPAPDFTEERYWCAFDEATRERLEREGAVEVPSAYSDIPYVITRALIEDGRRNLVFPEPLRLDCPTRILHGTADEAIPLETSLRLFDHAEGQDIRLTLVKGADHRFSTPDCLDLVTRTVEEIAA